MGARIAGDGHMLYWCRSTECQAGAGSLLGKPGPVLDAVQALLFDGGDQVAVFQQRGRCIAVERVQTENLQARVSS